jgi:hypothetical protein
MLAATAAGDSCLHRCAIGSDALQCLIKNLYTEIVFTSPGTKPHMESTRQTRAELLDVEKELIAREPIFHRPEFGTKRADFDAMMAEDFWETGASGACYDRTHVLDVLEARHAQPVVESWEASDFYCQRIAENNFLLTYTLRQGARVSRRATLWRRESPAWVIVYHQGTIVEAA